MYKRIFLTKVVFRFLIVCPILVYIFFTGPSKPIYPSTDACLFPVQVNGNTTAGIHLRFSLFFSKVIIYHVLLAEPIRSLMSYSSSVRSWSKSDSQRCYYWAAAVWAASGFYYIQLLKASGRCIYQETQINSITEK